MNRRQLVAMLGAVAAARPPAVWAQPRKGLPVVGFLGVGTAAEYAPWIAAVQLGLADAGYAVGQNAAMEFRWADGDSGRMPALAADLVHHEVNVIITTGSTAGILAAKHATTTIPIVFIGGSDLVTMGIVTSLARPGTNLTGFTIMVMEMMVKRLELLSELVPQAKVIALLVNPNNLNQDWIRDAERAAGALGVQLPILRAGNPGEIDAAFAALAGLQAGAVLIGADPYFNNRREQMVALAARHAIPAMHEWRESVELGGLCSYGPSLPSLWRQIGGYAGRILSGADVANLPIQHPARFELVINLKTAKALGLMVPPLFLARVDEVIE